MPPPTPEEFQIKGDELAIDTSKQFVALSLAGIAFAVSVTSDDATTLSHPLFWSVIGAFGLSTFLGFVFFLNGVARYDKGTRINVYKGWARWGPLLQIIFLCIGVGCLLRLHVDNVARKAGLQETRLTLRQGGKDTTLVVQPGKSVVMSVGSAGEIKAEVR